MNLKMLFLKCDIFFIILKRKIAYTQSSMQVCPVLLKMIIPYLQIAHHEGETHKVGIYWQHHGKAHLSFTARFGGCIF